MQNRTEIIEQTNLAFDFVEKLYLEVSYLIKEIEGILLEEEERFIIGRPNGYHVSARSSTGLESVNVNFWLFKKLATFFVPEDRTERKGGQTITKLGKDLKILYLRILLNDKDIEEPVVYSGVLYDIKKKPQAKWIVKFENMMQHFEYHDDKMFKNIRKINYEDSLMELQGELVKNNLFEINNSETIVNKIVKPSLDLYRKH